MPVQAGQSAAISVITSAGEANIVGSPMWFERSTRISQSARAAPGGSVALWAICTRRSVFA